MEPGVVAERYPGRNRRKPPRRGLISCGGEPSCTRVQISAYCPVGYMVMDNSSTVRLCAQPKSGFLLHPNTVFWNNFFNLGTDVCLWVREISPSHFFWLNT